MAIKDKIVDALLGTPTTVLPQNVDNFLKTLPTTEYGKNLTPDQIQGVAQGYNYGIAPIADMQKQLGIKAPQTADEFALASQGKLNYQGRTGGILPDLGRGFQQNYNNNLVQSLGQPLKNPNLATTLGGGLGTLTKIIDSPVGRGLIAAGAVKALGGSGGQALAQGLNAGMIRQDLSTQDKLYRNQLQQMGIDTSNIRGNVNKDTFKNISDNYNKRQKLTYQQSIANAKDDTQRVRIIMQALNNGIYTPDEANQLLKAYGLESQTQASNQTKMTDAKIKDMVVRQNLLAKKIANGTADNSLKEEFKRNQIILQQQNMALNNAALQQMGIDPNSLWGNLGGNTTPTPTPAKSTSTIKVGNKPIKVTKK